MNKQNYDKFKECDLAIPVQQLGIIVCNPSQSVGAKNECFGEQCTHWANLQRLKESENETLSS